MIAALRLRKAEAGAMLHRRMIHLIHKWRQHLEICWLRSAAEALLIQVEGSARVPPPAITTALAPRVASPGSPGSLS